jgi:hypothetical protein
VDVGALQRVVQNGRAGERFVLNARAAPLRAMSKCRREPTFANVRVSRANFEHAIWKRPGNPGLS